MEIEEGPFVLLAYSLQKSSIFVRLWQSEEAEVDIFSSIYQVKKT